MLSSYNAKRLNHFFSIHKIKPEVKSQYNLCKCAIHNMAISTLHFPNLALLYCSKLVNAIHFSINTLYICIRDSVNIITLLMWLSSPTLSLRLDFLLSQEIYFTDPFNLHSHLNFCLNVCFHIQMCHMCFFYPHVATTFHIPVWGELQFKRAETNPFK